MKYILILLILGMVFTCEGQTATSTWASLYGTGDGYVYGSFRADDGTIVHPRHYGYGRLIGWDSVPSKLKLGTTTQHPIVFDTTRIMICNSSSIVGGVDGKGNIFIKDTMAMIKMLIQKDSIMAAELDGYKQKASALAHVVRLWADLDRCNWNDEKKAKEWDKYLDKVLKLQKKFP